jgi:hypothetical protein
MSLYESTFVRNVDLTKPKKLQLLSESVFVHSSHRVSGTIERYQINLPVELKNVTSARLISAELPSIQNFNDSNTSLDIVYSGVQSTISIDHGVYTTGSSLVNALNTASSDLNFSYDTITGKCSISGISSYEIQSSPLLTLLGFSTGINQPSGGTVTGDRRVSVNTIPYLLLCIDRLNQNMTTLDDSQRVFTKVWLGQPTSIDGIMLFDKKFAETSCNPPQTMNRLDISWYDPHMQLIDFNGLEHSLTIEFMCSTSTRPL